MLTPRPPRLLDRDDVQIIEAIAASAPAATTRRSASPSTTRCATSEALEPLVEEEVARCWTASPARSTAERAVEIIDAGAEPLRDLIGAMHAKLLLAELRRQRGR